MNEESLKIISRVRLCWVLFLCGYFKRIKSVVPCVTLSNVYPVQMWFLAFLTGGNVTSNDIRYKSQGLFCLIGLWTHLDNSAIRENPFTLKVQKCMYWENYSFVGDSHFQVKKHFKSGHGLILHAVWWNNGNINTSINIMWWPCFSSQYSLWIKRLNNTKTRYINT